MLSKIGAELHLAEEPTPEAILRVARDADALLVTYAKITGEMIRQMKRCRIIARFGIGVDNVDIAAATAAGIVVTKVPDYCIDEVSDHAMALLLAAGPQDPVRQFARAGGPLGDVVRGSHSSPSGKGSGPGGFWQDSAVGCAEGKSLWPQGCDLRSVRVARSNCRAGVESVEFAELVKISDYISIHTPLMPETEGLFNADVLRQMKPTAYLINTARGPIVDEAALAHALDAGQLAGAALDVMAKEPPTASPLFGRDNVILTPHTSFYSEESLVDLQTKAAEEVVRVLTGQEPHYPVNPEALKRRNRDPAK